MKTIGRYLVIIAWGIVGMGLYQVGAHLYRDHQALHEMIGWINQQIQQRPAPVVPAGPVEPPKP